MSQPPRALIFCGNGFAFNEIFRPIIENLSSTHEIRILLADYYLAQHSLNTAERLLELKKIASYQIVHAFGEGQSIFRHHQSMAEVLKPLQAYEFDLLILGSDFYLFDRYLIRMLKSAKTKAIVVQTGVLQQVLEAQRRQQGLLPQLARQRAGTRRNIFERILKRLKMEFRLKLKLFWNRYFWPFWFVKTFFPPSPYDILGFTSGLADAVIGYDRLELEALQETVPGVKKLYLAAHPSANSCRCSQKQKAKNNLYVLLAGPLEEEMGNEILERWVRIIIAAAGYLKSAIVALRFHPRTQKSLHWPTLIQESLKKQLPAKLEIVDSLKVSLPESVCDYGAVIGAMSGSLRTARVACRDIPVIGLPNMSTPYDTGDHWLLGENNGIVLLKEDEALGPEHLAVPHFDLPNHPSVAQIINSQL